MNYAILRNVVSRTLHFRTIKDTLSDSPVHLRRCIWTKQEGYSCNTRVSPDRFAHEATLRHSASLKSAADCESRPWRVLHARFDDDSLNLSIDYGHVTLRSSRQEMSDYIVSCLRNNCMTNVISYTLLIFMIFSPNIYNNCIYVSLRLNDQTIGTYSPTSFDQAESTFSNIIRESCFSACVRQEYRSEFRCAHSFPRAPSSPRHRGSRMKVQWLYLMNIMPRNMLPCTRRISAKRMPLCRRTNKDTWTM